MNNIEQLKSTIIENGQTVEDLIVQNIATIGEKSRARLSEIRSSTRPADEIFAIVNSELVSILGGASRRISLAKTPPTVIMLAGLQGSGKTTLAAKLALFLKNSGNTPLLVAADLQRPNAVTQLSVLAESISVPQIGRAHV